MSRVRDDSARRCRLVGTGADEREDSSARSRGAAGIGQGRTRPSTTSVRVQRPGSAFAPRDGGRVRATAVDAVVSWEPPQTRACSSGPPSRRPPVADPSQTRVSRVRVDSARRCRLVGTGADERECDSSARSHRAAFESTALDAVDSWERAQTSRRRVANATRLLGVGTGADERECDSSARSHRAAFESTALDAVDSWERAQTSRRRVANATRLLGVGTGADERECDSSARNCGVSKSG
ncbi:hypothetical protein B0H15DRAFT_946031 [Mycena belliarum]|uniref:Uncharacterized protein n=1 Tax=Mycena belliarum TaxID=1033014 RepID=A0AAD6UB21_9AGAR|nr:hypothetical protein B0H15DRAFT_946031 [Mycena belliae]